jgi:protein involved in polysaccharide export with SLBB domain
MMARAMMARAVCAALLAALYCGYAARTWAQVPDASTHRIGIGDMLQITLYDGVNPLGMSVQVDNTGCVRMPLLDPVNVQGLFTYEMADRLTELYRTYYVSPVVSVAIQQYGTFQVYVFGPDVPGRLMSLPNGTRLLDLVQTMASAGLAPGQSLLTTGRFRRVHLIRGGFSLTALLAPPSQSSAQVSTSPAPNLLQADPPEAISHGNGSLAAFTNWRPWVEERKHDPDSKVWIIDPLRITVEGELSRYNMPLLEGDVIYLPSPERFVDMSGVTMSGRYELLGEESLGDIMRLAGSPNYEADLMNAVVDRHDEHGRLSQIFLNFYPALDDVEAARSFKLQNRDRINFFTREKRIFVLGEVHTAGAFAFQEDSTVLDYVAVAGGETEAANLAWIAIIRQGRDRLDPYARPEVIQVNFKQIHKGLPMCTDISLKQGDVIYVPPKGFEFKLPEILEAVTTMVTGFVVAENAGGTRTSVSPTQ